MVKSRGLADDQLSKTIQAMPKIDLHRHLEGSVRIDTLVNVAKEYGIPLADYSVEGLRPFVQLMPDETRNWQHFLSKFHVLRRFYQSPDIIRQFTREVVADAAADNVKYLELRFTPQALCNETGCSLFDAVDWVCQSSAEAAVRYDIQVGLILSMNRHEKVEIGEQVVEAALSHRDRGVVGLDLAGQEPGHSALPFVPLFQQAKAAGLSITIHAGEWGGAENVREAIDSLGADRIGHGVRAMEDPDLLIELAERQIVMELCPTSNVDSGVVANHSVHPLPQMFRQKLRTTINTDDPLISNITLSDEFALAVRHMDFTLDDLKQQTLVAANAAFLPDAERAALVARFENWLTAF
ncbi:MAG: adenosine deaminase [Burkholderiales bacterium]|nr:adenosine deaminase [Anaerolineae bacterium]